MVEPPLQVSGMSAVIAFRDDSQRTAESMLAQRNIRSGRSPAPQNSAPPADESLLSGSLKNPKPVKIYVASRYSVCHYGHRILYDPSERHLNS